jgi:hypothetical protein
VADTAVGTNVVEFIVVGLVTVVNCVAIAEDVVVRELLGLLRVPLSMYTFRKFPAPQNSVTLPAHDMEQDERLACFPCPWRILSQ